MTDEQARAILTNPSATESDKDEARAVLEPVQTLEGEYGCDPWDDEHHGKHPASQEPDPRRTVYGRAW